MISREPKRFTRDGIFISLRLAHPGCAVQCLCACFPSREYIISNAASNFCGNKGNSQDLSQPHGKTIAPRQARPDFCVRYHLPGHPLSVDSGGKLPMKPSRKRAACQLCTPISRDQCAYYYRRINRIEGIGRSCKPCVINEIDFPRIDTSKRLEIDVTH